MTTARLPRSSRVGSSNNTVLIVLIIVIGFATIGCLICGGALLTIASMGNFTDGSGLDFMHKMEVEVERQLQDHPDVQRELGEIESVSGNLFGSVEADEEFGSDDFWSFDVEGSKTNGMILVEARDLSTDSDFTRRILRTANGDFDLGPTPPSYVPLADEEMNKPVTSAESEESGPAVDVESDSSS